MEHKLLSKRKAYPVFCLLGFLFFFFSLTEHRLARDGNILWTGGYLLGLLGGSLAGGILLGGGICALFYAVSGRSLTKGRDAAGSGAPAFALQGKPPLARTEERLRAGGCFGISWLLLFLSWLPGFLAYYPAICAYDSPVQLGQIVNNSYVDHHPIAHTLLIKGFLNAGTALFGDRNAGIAMYALAQMLFLGFVFAAGIALLRTLGVKLPWLLSLVLLGMLFPIHWYMSVSMTKDTVFTGFVLLQLFCLCMLLHKGKNVWRPGLWDAGYLAAALGMILFRTNGRYALLALMVLEGGTVIFARREKKLFARLALNSLLAFVLGSVLLSALFAGVNAQQGDRREMLSMPIQQMARCMLYHGGAGVLPEDDNTMGEADKALINDFLLDGSYKKYRPDISDPVKNGTNTYVVRYRAKEFLGSWLRLLGRYPGDFINAALAVNAGYLYPGDVSHAHINEVPGLSGLGYIQTRWSEELVPWGVYKDTKWEWLHEKLERFADANAYLKLPLLRYLFVPGTYLWLCALLACWLLLRRRYRFLLPMGFVLGYYCTLFLGPTVQMRYLYPVMAGLPYLFAMCVIAGRPVSGEKAAEPASAPGGRPAEPASASGGTVTQPGRADSGAAAMPAPACSGKAWVEK